MKKTLSFLLVLCLMFSLSVSAFAATATPTVDPKEIKAGEDVTVTLSLSEPIEKVSSIEYNLYFNPDLFEFKDFTSLAEGINLQASSKAMTSTKGTYYYIGFYDTTSGGKGVTFAAGNFAKFTFTAKSDITAASDAKFELAIESLGAYNESGVGVDISDDHTVGEAATITVKPASAEPDGSAENPYLISSAADLIALSDKVKGGDNCEGQYYKVTDDITLDSSTKFSPIGSGSSKYFGGHFDGQGHTISGLYVDAYSNSGFFGYVKNATIENFIVKGTVTGSQPVGGVVGSAVGSTVRNIGSEIDIASSANRIGGVVGYLSYDSGTGNTSLVSGCYYSGTITSSSSSTGTGASGTKVGGIVGFEQSLSADNASTVENCYNRGTLSATGATQACIGGIVGGGATASRVTVKNSYNAGTVNATKSGYCDDIIGSSLMYASTSGCPKGIPTNAAVLGDAFKDGPNNYPILTWEAGNGEAQHVCTLVEVAEVPAKCTETGVAKHYKCTDPECGKLYTDDKGVNVTTLEELATPALGHLYNENLECTREGCTYVNPVLALIKEMAGENFTVTSSTTQVWQKNGTYLEANGADTAVFSLTAVKDGTLTVRASILGMMQSKLTITSGDTVKADLYSSSYGSYPQTVSEAIEVQAGETLTFTYSNQNINATAEDYYVRITGLTFEPKTTEPVLEGYTVAVAAASEEITVGSDAAVNLTVGHKDTSVTAFNSYNFALSYDPSVLTYKGVNLADAQVKDDNGTLTILGYGADNALTAPLTVTFTGKAIGKSAVTLTAANIDQKANAHIQDAPAAEILTKSADITVTKIYNVTLPEGFTGDLTVKHGDDYTFTADDTNYNYDFSGSTMGGSDVTVEDDGNGNFTVKNVTGDLDIKVTKTGKTFNVTVKSTTGAEADVTAAANATYMTDYTFTVTKNSSYNYTVSATVGGETCGLTENNGVYTIDGAKITGDIVITVNKTLKPATETNVKFVGDGAADVVNGTSQTAEINKDFTFTIDKKDGYKYTVKLADGSEITANADGSYTIPAAKVTADDVVVTVEKEGVATVEVTEYVQLDGQSVFLVLATGTPVEGKVFAYDGNAMYHSDKYGAYAYLIFSDKKLAEVKAEAETKVAEKTGVIAGEIDYSGNVNGTEKIDVNDAQLVWNMYNAQYSDFTSGATMEMFLRADVNGSKTVNTLDAAAVVDLIE